MRIRKIPISIPFCGMNTPIINICALVATSHEFRRQANICYIIPTPEGFTKHTTTEIIRFKNEITFDNC